MDDNKINHLNLIKINWYVQKWIKIISGLSMKQK